MIPGMIRHVSSDETAPPLRMIFLFEFPSLHHLFVARNGWHSVKCINRLHITSIQETILINNKLCYYLYRIFKIFVIYIRILMMFMVSLSSTGSAIAASMSTHLETGNRRC